MANNVLYLTCQQCPDAEPLYLAKYFPTQGWYRDDPLDLNQWLGAHRHGGPLGDYLRLVDESDLHGIPRIAFKRGLLTMFIDR
jgi:hypothetical protein